MSGDTTPAGELREAARLIRERAAHVPPAPWYPAVHDVTTYDGLDVIASSGLTVRAQYVASWHPGVALAVADWLEAAAERADVNPFGARDLLTAGLAVARAYLGTGEETTRED